MQKFIAVLLMFSLIITGSVPAFAATKYTEPLIEVNGEVFEADGGVLKESGSFKIYISELARILGGTYTVSSSKKEHTIVKNNLVMIFNTSELKYATLDNKVTKAERSKKLSANARSKGGKLYVPIKDVVEYLGASYSYDDDTNTIFITYESTVSENFTMFPFAELEQSDESVLTIDAALSKAIDASSKIKKSDEDYKQAQKRHDESIDDLTFTTSRDIGAYSVDSATFATLTTILTYEIQMAQNESSKKTTVEQLRQTITNYFVSLISVEGDIKLQEMKLENLEKKLKISETKLKLGKISRNDYNTQLNNYKDEEKALADKRLSLEAAYIGLNNAIGEKFDKRYNVELDFEFESLGEVDLDKHINKCISDNPNIKALEQSLTLAENKATYYTTNESMESKRTTVNQARRDLEDAKTALQSSIISKYNNLKKSEIAIEADIRNIDKLYNDLKLLETQLELGQIIPQDVEDFKYQIVSAEFGVYVKKMNLMLDIMLFYKPYLQ